MFHFRYVLGTYRMTKNNSLDTLQTQDCFIATLGLAIWMLGCTVTTFFVVGTDLCRVCKINLQTETRTPAL